MIEEVKFENQLIAIIIKAEYSKNEGIEFFTPVSSSQQLGYMKRAQGYRISPHSHSSVERKITGSQEVLFMKTGKVLVSFFNSSNELFCERIISKGDVLMLLGGGHGFEMLETSEIIEVKQGPYIEDKLFIKRLV
jgi:hypothetical protein